MEMEQQCRVCLVDSGSYYDIFDVCKSSKTYAENISHLADVNPAQHDDGLPQWICYECCDQIRRIYEFCLLIRRTDERLRKQLEEKRQQSLTVEEAGEHILEEDYILRDEDTLEEVLDGDIHEPEEITIVDYVKDDHDEEELQMVEVLEVDEEIHHIPDDVLAARTENDLLVELAQVAATQENVYIDDHDPDLNKEEPPTDNCAEEDECDDRYLIPYNPAEEPFYNFKPPKWKCGECKVILRGDVSYEGHMNIHKQLRPHKCPQCHCQFRCRMALKEHRERHNNVRESPTTHSKCIECNEECQNDVELLLHELLVHDSHTNITACPFCPDLIVDNLVDHLQFVHVNQSTQPRRNKFNSSSTMATTTTLWHCDVCSKSYRSLSAFTHHRNVCNTNEQSEKNLMDCGEETVHCEVCKRRILVKNLKRHMALHQRRDKKIDDDTRKFLCAYCPREFKNSKSLHQHERTTHQGESADTVYVCVECDRQYSSQYLLETHRKQAHKERDHVCSICGNAFKLKNQLVNHMKLHLEKNIQCPHCDKKYARQFDLNVHLRSHTGELPYACNLCDKRFAIKVRLTYHLQKHYGIKHQCKECQAEFNSKQKLKAHSFKHTGMPYRCELCDDHGFATRVVFRRHLNRVHQATMSDEALSEMFQRNTGKTIKIKQITEQPEDILEEEEELFVCTYENKN